MSSHKKNLTELAAEREALERTAKLDALARGVAVDPSKLAPDGSYDQPDFVNRGYYIDQTFDCEKCGKPQTWTARQQKWWYEVAKGGVWTYASLCRSCKRQEREEWKLRGRRGDPSRYKSLGHALAKVRRQIEPRLLDLGYRLKAQPRVNWQDCRFFEYSRPDSLLTIYSDPWKGQFVAEILTRKAILRMKADRRVSRFLRPLPTERSDASQRIAEIAWPDRISPTSIDAELAPFVTAVLNFVDGLHEIEPKSLKDQREQTDE